MAKKTAKTAAPAPAPAKEEKTPPVKADPKVETADNAVVQVETNGFADLFKKLNEVTSLVSSLKQEARALEKRLTRELRVAQKSAAKKKAGKGNRCPSGFVKPTLITDELAKFLGKPSGTEMARTEVTREINRYIRDNNLQDASNGRKINPDTKLSTLLKIGKKDELTYFNLQRYMSPHFAKGGVLPGQTAPATSK